jgi:hypothetical protein
MESRNVRMKQFVLQLTILLLMFDSSKMLAINLEYFRILSKKYFARSFYMAMTLKLLRSGSICEKPQDLWAETPFEKFFIGFFSNDVINPCRKELLVIVTMWPKFIQLQGLKNRENYSSKVFPFPPFTIWCWTRVRNVHCLHLLSRSQ